MRDTVALGTFPGISLFPGGEISFFPVAESLPGGNPPGAGASTPGDPSGASLESSRASSAVSGGGSSGVGGESSAGGDFDSINWNIKAFRQH